MDRVVIARGTPSKGFAIGATLAVLLMLLSVPCRLQASTPKELRKEADSLFDEQKWDKAQKKYEDLAKYARDDQRSYAQYRTGLCLSKLGKYPDALKTWEKLFTIDTYTEWSAQAMQDAAELSITQLKEKGRGIKLYERLLQTFPNYPNRDAILHKLAMQYFNDGSYHQALSTFRRLLTEYPKSTQADSARQYATLCEDGLNRHGPARPTAKSETALADKLYQMGDYQHARSKYDQIARDYSATEEAQYAGYRVGLCLFQQERYENAVKAWDDFLRTTPKGPYSRDALTQTAKTCAFYLRDTAQGLRRYEELLKKYPDSASSPEINYQLGGLYYTQGKWKEAKRRFETLLEQNPPAGLADEARTCLATCESNLRPTPGQFTNLPPLQALKIKADSLYEAKRYIDASQLYEELAISTPGTPEGQQAQFRAALALCNAGELPRAIARWRYFQAFCPDSPWADDALERIASVYLDSLDKEDDALTTYHKLLEKYPRSELIPAVEHQLGLIYLQRGDYTTARKFFEDEFSRLPPKKEHGPPTPLEQFIACCKDAKGITPAQLARRAGQSARLLAQGDIYFTDRNYQKALRAYERLVSRAPDKELAAYSLMQMGRCYNKLRDYQKALGCYKQFLTTYRDSQWADDALVRAGVIYIGPLRDRKSGIKMYQTILETYPTSNQADRAMLNIATLPYWDKDWKTALSLHQDFLAQYPASPFAFFVREKRIPAIQSALGIATRHPELNSKE